MTAKRHGTRVLKSDNWVEARVGSDAGLKAMADEVFSYRYEDLAGPATGINPPGQASDPDIDLDGGWSFSASQTNSLVIVVQFRHRWEEGTGIEPHVHWEQPASGDVLWRLEHKWYNNGDLVPASWTTIDITDGVFPYVSGTLGQISTFGEIDGTGKEISSILKMKLSRIGGDSADTLNDVVTMTSFDIHVIELGRGSERQYIKRI